MLINCPRCGFSQPEDQYCAQCGVDMGAFKPQEKTALQNLLQSTSTYVFLLFVGAVAIGFYVIKNKEPQRWVQKPVYMQGITKSGSQSNSTTQLPPPPVDSAKGASSESDFSSEPPPPAVASSPPLASLRNKELPVAAVREQPIQVGGANALNSDSTKNSESGSESALPIFHIIYAEVATETIARWINESSSAGVFQNLQEYSVGILSDYRKKVDSTVLPLKVPPEKRKLIQAQPDTTLSGTVNPENGQLIGLATTIELKSIENGVIHGGVVINLNQRQIRSSFPAEFDLPRGSAFFVLGTLRPNSFPSERNQLTMPPFQIFKSVDFQSGKTQFVVIIEPYY